MPEKSSRDRYEWENNPEFRAAAGGPYLSSRAWMREKFGPRRIDARVGVSARDNTPSGRQKRMEQEGRGPKEIKSYEKDRWSGLFPGSQWAPQGANPAASSATDQMLESGGYGVSRRPAANGAPTPTAIAANQPVRMGDMLRRRQAPQSPLDAIEQAQGMGMASAAFQTPYGPVGYDTRPSLMPRDPANVAGIQEYLGSMATGGMEKLDSLLFPWSARAKKPTVLDGAQKWLTPV